MSHLILTQRDLPLGVAQAAAYLAGTGIPAADYVQLLATRAAEILEEGKPPSYPQSLAAATQLTAERLATEDLAAAELVTLCAFLAPEPIPLVWLTNAAGTLPDILAARMADPLASGQVLGRVVGSSLGRLDQRGLQLHRLTQAILRKRLNNVEQANAAPGTCWGNPGRQPSRKRRGIHHLARLGAFGPSPACRRPGGADAQCRPARPGMQRMLVPAETR